MWHNVPRFSLLSEYFSKYDFDNSGLANLGNFFHLPNFGNLILH